MSIKAVIRAFKRLRKYGNRINTLCRICNQEAPHEVTSVASQHVLARCIGCRNVTALRRY